MLGSQFWIVDKRADSHSFILFSVDRAI